MILISENFPDDAFGDVNNWIQTPNAVTDEQIKQYSSKYAILIISNIAIMLGSILF